MKTKPRNLFSLPSVFLPILAAGFVNFDKPINKYFDGEPVDKKDFQRALYLTTASLVASAAIRYSEDKNEEIYTPKLLPGKNRIDVIQAHLPEEEDSLFIK